MDRFSGARSLTLQDYFDDDKRQVRNSQNRSVRNASPPQEAKQATEEIIKVINDGKKIKPDWKAIDGVRAEYKVNQIANQAGYNIKDPEQRQAVLDVYIPCISKKAVRSSNGQFDNLVEALGVNQIVSEFVEDFDFSQGGLVRVKNSKEVASISHQGPILR